MNDVMLLKPKKKNHTLYFHDLQPKVTLGFLKFELDTTLCD
jgi:hypothetical protein